MSCGPWLYLYVEVDGIVIRREGVCGGGGGGGRREGGTERSKE